MGYGGLHMLYKPINKQAFKIHIPPLLVTVKGNNGNISFNVFWIF